MPTDQTIIASKQTDSLEKDIRAGLTQVFKVTVPAGVTGFYATKMDLFFKKKSTTFGIEVCLVQLTEGQPDPSKVLPNSTIFVRPEDIAISDDGTEETTIQFRQPVFLQADSRYAFIVRALGNSPDFEIWTGVNGTKDIANGQTISSNPLSEESYFAKSSSAWAEIPNEDIKYRIYRAKFDIEGGYAMLRKSAQELLKLNTVAFAAGVNDIRAGDEVWGMSAGLADITVYAKVIGYDAVNNLMYLTNSSGTFEVGNSIMVVRPQRETTDFTRDGVAAALEDASLMAFAKVDEIVDFPAHALAPKIGNMSNALGSVSFQYKGVYKVSNTAVKETNSEWKAIQNQEELDFWDKTRYIMSKSNEVTNLSANSSIDLKLTFDTDSDFASPIIDLREHSVIGIKNLIGSDYSNEDGEYGLSQSKYISKIITLADGQESEDLKVFVTANKPPHTIMQVYAKFWNAEDPRDFDTKKWTLLDQTTDASLFSDPKNSEDYREYEFNVPAAAPVAGAGYSPFVDDLVDGDPVRYESDDGKFIGFKKFAIKIVLAVDSDANAYNYPRINDVRAICLQK
jgi:hypothetical protein